MKYEWLDAYLLSLPGAEKDYKPEWQWFRYRIRGKLFAAVCSPDAKYQTYGGHDLVNLKCDPAEAELLRAQYPEILPGFYTDKRTWIAALLRRPARRGPAGAVRGDPPGGFGKAPQIRTEGNFGRLRGAAPLRPQASKAEPSAGWRRLWPAPITPMKEK